MMIANSSRIGRAGWWYQPAVALLLLNGVLLVGCYRYQADRGVDILSRTTVTGTVNGSPFKGQVSATLNTRRGGSSSCVFDQLPQGFTPASLTTQA